MQQAACHAVFTVAWHLCRPSKAARRNPFQEPPIADKGAVHIKLTPEQQEIVRKATGKNAEALELTAQELEERIAPMQWPAQQA